MPNPLLDLMTQGESGAASYDAYNRGTYMGADHKPHIRGADGAIDFSTLTLAQVSDRQHAQAQSPDRLFAVGKYQIIPATMDAAIDALQLNRSQMFTPALQDRIFSEYLIVDKRPNIQGYITSKPTITLEAAQHSLAQEWASFGDPRNGGRSHYPPPNHASITVAQSANALNQMRTEYQADISRGLSPAEAWKDVTAGDPSPAQARRLLRLNDHGDDVRALQTHLAQLGYVDAHGHPLKADGNFGPNTRFAVEAFQRDHHLAVDGKVGAHTQAALDQVLKMSTQHAALLSDPRHPDHPLFRQALAGVHEAEAQRHIGPGLHSERLAAALVVAARSEGITRIDGVVLSERGERAFIEQKGAIAGINDKIAFVGIDRAIHTTIAQSTATLAKVNQQQGDLAHTKTQIPLPSSPEPTVPGHMR